MKPGVFLVDTGALVALLDRSDPAHGWLREAWSPLIGRFHTTGAVVTEAMHFLHPIPGGAAALTGLLGKVPIHIDDTFSPAQLEAAVALMARYADAPMDFADATLVLLAERLWTPNILTLDERGFRTFRFAGKRHFRLVLQDG
ncbi:MAG: PIN domain-containing protein [Verrucomicrobia bacterium]|nr:PIN domain-containing protein [Verrucomicrobiota bacterium]